MAELKNWTYEKETQKRNGEKHTVRILVVPANEKDGMNWKVRHGSGWLYFDTKKSVRKNLDRIFT